MRTVSIVGARPQFVKLAPVSRAMADPAVTGGQAIDDIIVHTGQHYDAGMSDVFFDELEIPRPSVHLGIGSGSHGVQTGRMLEAIEATLIEKKPDFVIIYGDTNSTLAGALAASKLHIPIAHIEAGLRSFNRDMPEEVNRIVADHLSEILFAPTPTAVRNLAAENLSDRTTYSGDVMLDAVLFNSQIAEERSTILTAMKLVGRDFAVATLHRAATTDSDALLELMETLNEIAGTIPVVFPVHPRTKAKFHEVAAAWKGNADLMLIDPLGYLDMLKLLKHARVVLTDSGGLQKEALFVGTPCITLREETEWPETIDAGGNILVGTTPRKVKAALSHWLDTPASGGKVPSGEREKPFGEGDAAAAIVRGLLR
jgi:UDP-GlcNAc3NAcA epimerase